jgi:hypothetical protein
MIIGPPPERPVVFPVGFVALLQRRGGYRSAASRAFVALAQDYTKAIDGRGRSHPRSAAV